MTVAWPSAALPSRIPSSTRSQPAPLGLQLQLLLLHQRRQRPLHRLIAAGLMVLICPALTRGQLECFSLLMGSFTSWAAVTLTMSRSLIPLSTTRAATAGQPSQPLILTLLPTTWLVAC